MMSHLPEELLSRLADEHPALPAFLSERLPDVLALGIGFPPERLHSLPLQIVDVSALETHPGFVRVLFDGGLYELSIRNLDFVFRAVLAIAEDARPHEQNYTLALETGSAPLLARIEDRFDEYLEAVLLRLPDNRLENVAAMRRIVTRTDVDERLIVRFLERQTASLPTLDDVPAAFTPVLFEIRKIEATWENCLAFIIQGTFNESVLTDFLNSAEAVATLSRQVVPDGEAALPLREFLIKNDALSDAAYAAYAEALPRKLTAFPDGINPEKIRLLAGRNRVEFSGSALTRLNEDRTAEVAFARNNIDEFLAVQDDCDLDDDFREKLLATDISDENRLEVIRSMDLGALDGEPARAAAVGGILLRTGVTVDNLDLDGARAAIKHVRPLQAQIGLLNMLHHLLDDGQVRGLLSQLPPPLPEIGPGWATPRLEGSETNIRFATWLKARGFISSWKRGGLLDDDIRINLFRK